MLDLVRQSDDASRSSPFAHSISPVHELGAYEALWLQPQASFKTIAELFARHPGAVPSDFIDSAIAEQHADRVLKLFRSRGVGTQFGVRVHGAGEYPERLRDAEHPIELLY